MALDDNYDHTGIDVLLREVDRFDFLAHDMVRDEFTLGLGPIEIEDFETVSQHNVAEGGHVKNVSSSLPDPIDTRYKVVSKVVSKVDWQGKQPQWTNEHTHFAR